MPATAVAVTVKLALVKNPFEIAQDELARIVAPGLLVIAQPVSAVLNPLPATTTEVPAGPELGVRVILGAGWVTVKVAVAKSPVDPLT